MVVSILTHISDDTGFWHWTGSIVLPINQQQGRSWGVNLLMSMQVFNQWRGLIIYRINVLYEMERHSALQKSDLGFITPLKRNYVIICDDITD